MSIDGICIDTATQQTFDSSFNIYLFSSDFSGTAGHITQLYIKNCKIYDDDELLRDLVPCYRKSDNEIGMYDLVNSVF